MGATAAAFATFVGGAGTAAAAAPVYTTIGSAATGAAAFGAADVLALPSAGVFGGLSPGWLGAASAAQSLSDAIGGAGAGAAKSAAAAGASAAASSLLAPKPPKAPEAMGMPDPLAQAEARRKSLAEQAARSGRAASILTSPSERLGN